MRIIGMDDERIGVENKIFVMQKDITVVAFSGPNTSINNEQSWSAPGEHDNLRSRLDNGGGVAKAIGKGMDLTGATGKTALNTALVWGSGSHSITLHCLFYATPGVTAEHAVSEPMTALDLMASSDISAAFPMGRQPESVTVCLFRRLTVTNCKIQSVPIPLGNEKMKGGHQLRAETTIEVKPAMMLDRKDMAAVWGVPG